MFWPLQRDTPSGNAENEQDTWAGWHESVKRDPGAGLYKPLSAASFISQDVELCLTYNISAAILNKGVIHGFRDN